MQADHSLHHGFRHGPGMVLQHQAGHQSSSLEHCGSLCSMTKPAQEQCLLLLHCTVAFAQRCQVGSVLARLLGLLKAAGELYLLEVFADLCAALS